MSLIDTVVDKGREAWVRWRLRGHLFKHVEVESVTVCNLRCTTCPNRDHPRSPQVMPMTLWARIVKELAALGYTGTFSPHFYNEPLLDPDLEQRLSLVRRWLPHSAVLLFTNFTRMTPERYRALEPLVDRIIVTLDAVESRRALEQVMATLPSSAQSKVQRRWLEELGVFNRGGTVRLPGRRLEPVHRCRLPADYLVISADGDVHLCYNDYQGRAVMGNVARQSIREIWFSSPFLQARVDCYLGRCSHPLCRGCRSNREG